MAEPVRYTIETGASKTRKKEAETERWNSLNGPVVVKIVGLKDGK